MQWIGVGSLHLSEQKTAAEQLVPQGQFGMSELQKRPAVEYERERMTNAMTPAENKRTRVYQTKKRPVRIEGNVAFVILTMGYEAIIDVEDVPLVAGYNWCAVVRPRSVYAASTLRRDGKQRIILMHRAIMGGPDGIEVDHINGDGLDNRKRDKTNNLRLATKSQNQCNSRNRADNTSGRKGVSWHKQRGKWAAQIALDGKKQHLGLFETIEQAAIAYAEASARLHGKFGRHQ